MPISNFKDLCDILKIGSEYIDEIQLNALIEWCNNNITPDIDFLGNGSERYNQYMKLATHYLEDFLAPVLHNKLFKIDGLNSIQYAAYHGYDFYLRSLTLSRNDLNEANLGGMTPLHLAAIKGNVGTVNLLLEMGANPISINQSGQLPAHCALEISIIHDNNALKNKEIIFQKLKPITGDKIHCQDNSGNNVLHLICAFGYVNLVQELISENVDLAFFANKHGLYPIHIAILNKQPLIAQLLLEIKQISTLTDHRGRTPLHYAALYGTQDLVYQCCNTHSNRDLLDHEGNTPFDLAREKKNMFALEVLINHR